MINLRDLTWGAVTQDQIVLVIFHLYKLNHLKYAVCIYAGYPCMI